MKTSLRYIFVLMCVYSVLCFYAGAEGAYLAEYRFDDGFAVSFADGGEYETTQTSGNVFGKFGNDKAMVSKLEKLPYDKSANLRFNLSYGGTNDSGWSNPGKTMHETTLCFDAASSGDADRFELVGRPAFVAVKNGTPDCSAELKGYKTYLKAEGGKIYVDGTETVAVPDMTEFNEIAVTLHPEALSCDIYINGRLAGSGIRLSDSHTSANSYKFVGFSWLSVRNVYTAKEDAALPLRNGMMGLDNLVVYEGGYRGSGSALYMRQNFDNQSTWKSWYTAIEKQAPDNGPKNTVTLGNDEKYNHGGYIRLDIDYIENDCMIDMSFSEVEKQLVMSFDFLLEDNCIINQLFFLRDSSTNDENVNFIPAYTDSSGNFRAAGRSIRNVNDGQWHSAAVAIDLKNMIYDVYLDEFDVPVAANCTVPEKFRQLNLFRIRLSPNNVSTGTLFADNILVYSGLKPRVVADSEIAAGGRELFKNNSYARRLLAGMGAVNPYSKTYWDGTERKNDSRIYYENDTAYVPLDIFEEVVHCSVSCDGDKITAGGCVFTAGTHRYSKYGDEALLDAAVVLRDGTVYMPLKEAVDVMTGVHAIDDLHGLILVGNEPITYSSSAVKEISMYMFFDRKSKAEISEMVSGIQSHPRILANKDDFERVRGNIEKNGHARYMYDAVIKNADQLLKKEPIKYVLSNKKLLSVSSDARSRMMLLGFAYRMTGDMKYVDNAMENIRAACSFPDWNAENHFLDPSEMSMAFALAYDWMYDALTEDDKSLIKEYVKKYALDYAFGVYTANSSINSWWATTPLNWNGVCNGGIGCAALAFADEEPEYCSELLYNILRCSEYAWYQLAPDGAWEESPGYWRYYLQYESYLFSSVEKSFGTDLGLWNFRGAKEFGFFPTVVSSECGSYNFHDSASGFTSDPAMYFMSDKLDIDSLTTLRTYDILNHGVGCSPSDLLWYKPERDGTEFSYPRDNYLRDIEMVTMREKWFDKNSMFAAYHGGDVKGAHMHYDTGSFVYDVNGVRWAMDLGSDDYYYYTLYGDDNIYRKRAEGHNIFVINPSEAPGQEGNFGRITRFETNGNEALSTVDLSECYASYAFEAGRGLKTEDGKRSLVVQDEIELSGEYPMYWFVHTQAQVVKISDNKFILKRNGQSLAVIIDTNLENFTADIMEAKPLDTSPPLGEQNPNTGISKIAVYSPNASGTVRMTMKFCPIGEGFDENSVDVLPISDWSLPCIDEGFDNFPENSGSSIAGGLFGKAADDCAIVTGSCEISGMKSAVKPGDLLKLSADIAPMGNEARLELYGTEDGGAETCNLGSIIAFGRDGSLSVFGEQIFASGEPFYPDKWYHVDVLLNVGDSGVSATVYIDNVTAAKDISVPIVPDSISCIKAVSDGQAAFDGIYCGAAEAGRYRELRIVHADADFNRLISSKKGISIFETKQCTYTVDKIKSLGISGGILDKEIRISEHGDRYLRIASSNGNDVFIPLYSCGIPVCSGDGESCGISVLSEENSPCTVRFALPYGDTSVSIDGNTVFDSSSCALYDKSAPSVMTVTFYPKNGMAEIFINGKKAFEFEYSSSASEITAKSAAGYVLYTGAHSNDRHISAPEITAADSGFEASFFGRSVEPVDVIFAVMPEIGDSQIIFKRVKIYDRTAFSVSFADGKGAKVMVMSAENLMPLAPCTVID